MGNSRPLARWTVRICTASESESSRRLCCSASAAFRARLTDPSGQPRPQGGEAQLCRGCFGVQELGHVAQVGKRRSPIDLPSKRAGKPFADADVVEKGGHAVSAQQGRPLVEAGVKRLPVSSRGPRPACGAVIPMKAVSAAATASDRAVGCSRASSNLSQSRAAGVDEHAQRPGYDYRDAGGPERGLHDRGLAVGADQDADVAGADRSRAARHGSPSSAHVTRLAPEPSKSTTSAARSSATNFTAESFCISPCPGPHQALGRALGPAGPGEARLPVPLAGRNAVSGGGVRLAVDDLGVAQVQRAQEGVIGLQEAGIRAPVLSRVNRRSGRRARAASR